jgi:hypothetical protein
MTKYKIIVSQTDFQEFIIEAESSDEAIDIVKAEIGMEEISGDVEEIE